MNTNVVACAVLSAVPCSVRCPQRIRTLRWGLATASKLWTLQRNHGQHLYVPHQPGLWPGHHVYGGCKVRPQTIRGVEKTAPGGKSSRRVFFINHEWTRINTNVVACAVLSAFGLSAGDSPRRASCGLYSVTTDCTPACNAACPKLLHR